MTANPMIGVIGAGTCDDRVRDLAYRVGEGIAKAGYPLICGGLGGVMEAACHGAFDAGGTTIGILPGESTASANRYVVLPIATGIGIARNVIIVRSSRVLIAVSGGPGTLSEMAFALQLGVPVVSLESHTPSQAITIADDPDDAVCKALRLAGLDKERQMSNLRQVGTTRIVTVRGDITKQATDAIVNAANSTLMGGGGVDGAIHRAGGPKILEECEAIVEESGQCPTGDAVITTGGNLPAKWVVHTVGPIWRGGNHDEPELLASAYQNSLAVARSRGVQTISFPSISTGAYRFPVDKAATIALTTVAEYVKANPFDEVRFVLFSEDDLNTYSAALANLTLD
ncbi:MAG: O-acetyl-ADP-ribose deacetylase [Candidatus Latescibacterota bacterium]|nr:MAG: O-acetyl-ADP-ribose deacetylase [Candidatus Latescibacterota bacterium]